MSNSLKEQLASTPLFGANASAVERLYEQYLVDPQSIPAGWRDYFEQMGDPDTEIVHSKIREELLAQAASGRRSGGVVRQQASRPTTSAEKQAAVARLIQVYSLRGHQIADIDPLGLMERRVPGVLKLDYLGLTEADMESEFYTGGLAGTPDERLKLREMPIVTSMGVCPKHSTTLG